MLRRIMRIVAVLSILWGIYVIVAALPMMASYREQRAYVALRTAEALVAKSESSATVAIDTATLRDLSQGVRIREDASCGFWGLAAINAVALIGVSALYLVCGSGAAKDKKAEPGGGEVRG